MVFIHSKNEHRAVLRNGDVVRFESEEEALAARAMYEDVQEVLGKKTIPQAATPPAHPGFPETNTMSLGVVQQRSQKKVRITIDPDVEFVGTPSTTSQAKRSPSLGDGGMKKALA